MAVTITGMSRLVPQAIFLCPQHILWLTLAIDTERRGAIL